METLSKEDAAKKLAAATQRASTSNANAPKVRDEGATKKADAQVGSVVIPSVFSYLDYRAYLKDFYNHKKSINPNFSLTVFSEKAGLATRNYLKRVMDGERPLNSELIPKFCLGLGLGPKEKVYFEALVNFNQTKDVESKKHYFNALTQATEHVKGSVVEVARDQFEVYGHWHILPIRELVLLKDFEENPNYIVRKMKNKISKKQAQEAIDVLLRIGLLVRDPKTQKLKQANPVIVYDKGVVNMVVREFHKQTLDRTKEAIAEDDFESWDLRSLALAVPQEELKNISGALKDFIHELNMKHSLPAGENNKEDNNKDDKKADAVILLNAQLITITK